MRGDTGRYTAGGPRAARSAGCAPAVRWQAAAAATTSAGPAAPRGMTVRMWVEAGGGTPVRERPWGRVVGRKTRGALLRLDGIADGWGRLEEDFVETGVESVTASSLGFALDSEGEEEELRLLEGWVLLDGRDLGLPRQLVAFGGEADAPPPPPPGWVLLDGRDLGLPRQLVAFGGEADAPPPPPPPAGEEERAVARRAATAAAEAEEGHDNSIGALLEGAGLPEELAAPLQAAGIIDLPSLLVAASRGDVHRELRGAGVSKLGQRQKLSALVAPHWEALSLKERGNEAYRESRFEAAAEAYSRALAVLPCAYTDLALACYSNRAACRQQMREPEAALADTLHVLRYDPANPKAVARRRVYEQALQGA
eukprot:CAMPEP_0185401936 /NCGR_PEP_ID=MMETSP1364-20130426/91545_1 /TAXON_ID=38817 /ORGANISM="Gephyrocapsa oceanica, Strain RCC1303" /LENGTH=367 /DNA_ID=CAMNT_0028004233 /DNA_START=340 /DNA_END=1443 /DNA_ORIENTATION=-